MILNGKEISNRLVEEDIGISPPVDWEQIQPASLDVRFGRKLYNVAQDEVIEDDETHTIKPGIPYIGHTLDTVDFPRDVAAQLTGRSTYGRKFVLMHVTAGWIDPGFEGQITLEIYNLGTEPVDVDVGDRVAQLVFFPLTEPSTGYEGRYQGQEGITLDR